ncbi:hypothetical protein [Singulisphaera acidiphila]|uniref:Uncharacterized protein n=1 Tax=Singulisphaera acidiphila (strain ATCC BAA-1392 / DSM 18658 / VKM B-2454 / MOB10) TaxID=886293 RepID=L0DBN7_SINAD|nr:hypothetical protein [Singulisphaera acidiphila]AGA26657.1 hypothetical protein Sinac_2345 [Singulisphaera acidiphila DSM 18658]
MGTRSKRDAVIRSLVILCSFLCCVGATASFYVVLVRVPALANTKLDILFGTLQGVAVGLLFAIAALLTNFMHMYWRANQPSTLPLVND